MPLSVDTCCSYPRIATSIKYIVQLSYISFNQLTSASASYIVREKLTSEKLFKTDFRTLMSASTGIRLPLLAVACPS